MFLSGKKDRKTKIWWCCLFESLIKRSQLQSLIIKLCLYKKLWQKWAFVILAMLDSIIFFGRVGDYWQVSDRVGNTAGHLKARAGESSQSTPPRKGWQYWAESNYQHDPKMECGKPSLSCNSIFLTISGKHNSRTDKLKHLLLSARQTTLNGRLVDVMLLLVAHGTGVERWKYIDTSESEHQTTWRSCCVKLILVSIKNKILNIIVPSKTFFIQDK